MECQEAEDTGMLSTRAPRLLTHFTLRLHNIQEQERTQQVIPVRGAIPHSDYKPRNFSKGIAFLRDFILMAAHCRGRVISVTLGAHNIQKQEKTQQVMTVRQAIHHPDYNPKNLSNDVILLQLERKAKQTAAVRIISLPRGKAQVKPREVCSVAGWGKVSPVDRVSDTLQDVELTVQKDDVCYSHFPHHCNQATQICVGDPKKMKNCFRGQKIACQAEKEPCCPSTSQRDQSDLREVLESPWVRADSKLGQRKACFLRHHLSGASRTIV
nr:granzyme B(G,H)-like [Equus caballus]